MRKAIRKYTKNGNLFIPAYEHTLLNDYKENCKLIEECLEQYVSESIGRGETVILEGVHLRPEFM